MFHASTDLPTPAALSGFLQSLVTDGEAWVGPYNGEDLVFDTECHSVLVQLDDARRIDLGADLPPINKAASEWAAKQLYRAGQFLVCRDVPEAVVAKTLSEPCSAIHSAESDYSVDLFFHFLPDLFEIANRIAPGDSLVSTLRDWARDWPLSSVGIKVDGGISIDTFKGNRALMRLYADRVVERSAKDRLHSAELQELIRADAGLYQELLPSFLINHD
ncbi:MAG: hypothetical protein QM715_09910 [Nibricoccus sp.]